MFVSYIYWRSFHVFGPFTVSPEEVVGRLDGVPYLCFEMSYSSPCQKGMT